jgi:hypothetical protein
MSLSYVLLPAFLVHIHSTLATIVDTNSGFFATDRTIHDLLPALSFFPDSEGLDPFPFPSRESVT